MTKIDSAPDRILRRTAWLCLVVITLLPRPKAAAEPVKATCPVIVVTDLYQAVSDGAR